MMALYRASTTDNNNGSLRSCDEWEPGLRRIADIPLGELAEAHPGLLVYPPMMGAYGDDIGSMPVCSYRADLHKVFTGNTMGYVGVNGFQLSIRSRFDIGGQSDHMLHYMLCKVFCPTILDLPVTAGIGDGADISAFLFPHYLRRALSQGIYREYRRREYNDSRIRGALDIGRHIRQNIPFNGNAAYAVREHSYDNHVTELVRHTVEYLMRTPVGRHLLQHNRETAEMVRAITDCTPSYDPAGLHWTMTANYTPVQHPYYTEYRPLQALCMAIMQRRKMVPDTTRDRVSGILFDGAWLWEEYLATLLRPLGYAHPHNRTGMGGIWLFSEKKYRRYPDFHKNGIVLDAKYKRLKDNAIPRDDMHQIISYMHVTGASAGGFIYPSSGQTTISETGTLNGHGGRVALIALAIPQGAATFGEFAASMAKAEQKLTALVATI